MLVVARDITGPSGAGSIGIQCLMHGLQNLGVSTHTQVIVRAPDRNPLIAGCHVGLWKLLGEAVDVIEIPVRFVLVFLFEFGIVESFVVKFRWHWRSRLRA